MDQKLLKILDDMTELPEFAGCSLHSVNEASLVGTTPLHVAAIWGDAELIDTLIVYGANVDAVGDRLLTPLHEAVLRGHLEAAKRLLKHGANPLHRNDWNLNALELAMADDQHEIATLLRSCSK
jgi:ankyrin repeat protein